MSFLRYLVHKIVALAREGVVAVSAPKDETHKQL